MHVCTALVGKNGHGRLLKESNIDQLINQYEQLIRLKSIMLLNLPIILSGSSSPIILEIIPTKIDLLTKPHANLLINTK